MLETVTQVPAYTWHQSHDQATVLFFIPSTCSKGDIDIRIEQNYIVARAKLKVATNDGGDEAKWVNIIKGRLYRTIDKYNSLWQLEKSTTQRPTSLTASSGFSTRSSSPIPVDITNSPTPSRSSGGSYAVVGSKEGSGSDHDSNSQKGRSLTSSGILLKSSAESLVHVAAEQSMLSASIQSLQTSSTDPSPPPSMSQSGLSIAASASTRRSEILEEKLVTLHLEKLSPEIWQHLIVGPIQGGNQGGKDEYDVDVTSMALVGVSKLSSEKMVAFEWLLRAYQEGKSPLATVTLVNHFANFDDISKICFDMPTPPSPDATVLGKGTSTTRSIPIPVDTQEILSDRLGGTSGIAQLGVDAGLAVLLVFNHPQQLTTSSFGITVRDIRERNWLCGRFFARAKEIDPSIFIPEQTVYGIRDVKWEELNPALMSKKEEEERSSRHKKEIEKQLAQRRKKKLRKDQKQKEFEKWVEVRFYAVFFSAIATASLGVWWWQRYKSRNF